VRTGLPVWSAVTLGPRGDYCDAEDVAEARRAALDAGAEAFLVNCSPPPLITAMLDALAAGSGGAKGAQAVTPDVAPGASPGAAPDAAPRPTRLGAYGNDLFEGHTAWSPGRYAEEAAGWARRGASILGGCCGTTPAHLAALRARLRDAPPRR
jgi:S-methylmethionine-dependent homocysteine/selenocysteine methylase